MQTKFSKIKRKDHIDMGFRTVNLVTCDRCKSNGTFDIGTVLPDEWLRVDKIGYLCPDCAEQFRRFMCNFMVDAPGYSYPEEWEPEVPYRVMTEEYDG